MGRSSNCARSPRFKEIVAFFSVLGYINGVSKNNLIKYSDKKFIRLEKSRIRRQFLDVKKQEELINNLYKRFVKQEALPAKVEPVKVEKAEKVEKAKVQKKVKVKK